VNGDKANDPVTDGLKEEMRVVSANCKLHLGRREIKSGKNINITLLKGGGGGVVSTS
jgi:hypothetical protein